MKIACWNIRGFNKPLKQKSVQAMVKLHNLDILCLLETKLDIAALDKFQRIRFTGMSCINNFAYSTKIRIALFWNPV